MPNLEFTFTNDTVFKMLFAQRPHLLKRLVAGALGIDHSSIASFVVTNLEIPPENADDKFCMLDLNVEMDGMKIDIEVQAADEGDYTERALYYWSREYSLRS